MLTILRTLSLKTCTYYKPYQSCFFFPSHKWLTEWSAYLADILIKMIWTTTCYVTALLIEYWPKQIQYISEYISVNSRVQRNISRRIPNFRLTTCESIYFELYPTAPMSGNVYISNYIWCRLSRQNIYNFRNILRLYSRVIVPIYLEIYQTIIQIDCVVYANSIIFTTAQSND